MQITFKKQKEVPYVKSSQITTALHLFWWHREQMFWSSLTHAAGNSDYKSWCYTITHIRDFIADNYMVPFTPFLLCVWSQVSIERELCVFLSPQKNIYLCAPFTSSKQTGHSYLTLSWVTPQVTKLQAASQVPTVNLSFAHHCQVPLRWKNQTEQVQNSWWLTLFYWKIQSQEVCLAYQMPNNSFDYVCSKLIRKFESL